MAPLAAHVQRIEAALNACLGLDADRPPAMGAERHQFVFAPAFYPSSTLVVDASAGRLEAFFALARDLGSDGESGCWQDLQPVGEEASARFVRAARSIEPWRLPDADTYSRDGVLWGYRWQTAERAARFYAFNPERMEHARQIAWLGEGVELALGVFRSPDTRRYLERLRDALAR